jgi:protein-arginine kinase
LLQISQHVSFQQDEIRAFRLLETVCQHLIRAEQEARLRMLTADSGAGRTYLRSVRRNLAKMQRIRLDAGMKVLAMLRLSLSLQLIRSFRRRRHIRRQLEALDQMWVRIQPAHVRKTGLSTPQVADRSGTAVWHGTDDQEDQIRANVIQSALGRWE